MLGRFSYAQPLRVLLLATVCSCGSGEQLYGAADASDDGASDVASLPGDAGVVPTISIAVGLFFTCALTTGGTVKCWGYNANGTLGDGTYADSTTPEPVSNLSGALGVVAGSG